MIRIFLMLPLLVVLAACSGSGNEKNKRELIPSIVETLEDTPVSFQAFRHVDEQQLLSDFQKPVNGDLIDNGDATITYLPRQHFNGQDKLTMFFRNGEVRTIGFLVTEENDAPLVQPDIVVSQQGHSVWFNPLANDFDIERSALSVSNIGDPAGGSLQKVNGGFQFTPNDGYVGDETISYTASDGTAGVIGSIHLFVFDAQRYITGIRLSPPDTDMALKEIKQYQLLAVLSDDSTIDITQSATWRISEPAVLAAAEQGVNGKFKAVSVGSVEIRANYGGDSVGLTINVSGQPPQVPSYFSAVPAVESVHIDWQPVDGAQSYNLYVSSDTQNSVIANATPPYVHKPLTGGERYRYRLSAVNKYGESEKSQWALATALARPVDAQISAAFAAQPGRIEVSWNNQAAYSYRVAWSDKAIIEGVDPAGESENATSPFVFSTGEHNRVYYFRVSAIDTEGKVVDTDFVSALFKRQPPAKPVISLIEVFDGELRIHFDHNSSYQYQLHWMQGDMFDPLKTIQIPVESSPYQHFPLINGLTYHYQLTASDGELTSLPSDPVSAAPETAVVNQVPRVQGVGISDDNGGTVVVDTRLTVTYTYVDDDEDPQDLAQTQYQWFRDGDPILDATSVNYDVASEDSGASLTCEVVPIAQAGANPGAPVLSPAVTVQNSPPSASNLNAAESYNQGDPAFNLVTIVITEPDNDPVTAVLTLSDPAAGNLSTGTSGSVTSTFSNGVWTAAGPVTDVNALLAQLQLVPAPDHALSYSIGVSIDDGNFPALAGTKVITVNAGNVRPQSSIAPVSFSPLINDTIRLDGTGSLDADGNLPLTYQWVVTNIPDGGTTTLGLSGPYPVVTFPEAGQYSINLTVTDSLGSADLSPATVMLRVTDPAAIISPRFAYTANLGDRSISRYLINHLSGRLRYIGKTPAPNSIRFLALHPNGQSLYAASSNGIAQYDIAADGDLAPKIPATVPTATTGSSVAVLPNGNAVYSVGVSQSLVYQFTINGNGGLTPMAVPTQPAGTSPIEVAVHPSGNSVYVVNINSNNISQYSVNADHSLSPLNPATVTSFTGPTGIAIHPNGNYAYVVNTSSNTVTQFSVAADGRMTEIPGSLVSTGSSPGSVAVDPGGRYVYVANQSGGRASQYLINANGSLTPMPDVASGAGGYSVTADPSGRFVYMANYSSSDISQYRIGSGGELLPMEPAIAASHSAPYSIVVSGGDPVVVEPYRAYAANDGSATVSQYQINTDGTLTALQTPSVSAGSRPYTVRVEPGGHFAYVSNFAGSTVSQYAIDTAGALVPLAPGQVTASGPIGLDMDPLGRYLYVGDFNGASVYQYTIDSNTGVLTPMTTANVAAGGNTVGVAVDPTGRYVYAANRADNTISQFTIGPNGELAPMIPATAPAVSGPFHLDVDPSGRYLYVGNINSGGNAIVSQYRIGADGTLTPLPTTTAVTSPIAVATGPLGQYAYVANYVNAGLNISQYFVSNSGNLAPLETASVTSANLPFYVDVNLSGRFVYVANYTSAVISQFKVETDGSLTPLVPATAATGVDPRSVTTTVRFR